MEMNDNVNSPRRYRSPRREQQAMATRQAILDAAQELFTARGYVLSSIREIADLAGVAIPTVYAVFKDKASVLWALVELIISGDGVGAFENSEIIRQMKAEADFTRRLEIVVRWSAIIMEKGIAEIEAAVVQAAVIDPKYQSLLRQAAEKRRENDGLIVDLLLEVAPSEPELSHGEIVELIGAVIGSQSYRMLVKEAGWSIEMYERSMLGIYEAIILGARP